MSGRLRQRWGDLQLRGKGAVVVAIPLAVLALAAALALIATHYNAQSASLATHSRDVEAQIATVQSVMADDANDQSDYMLVGNVSYLRADQQEKQALSAALDQLAAEVSNNAAQGTRVAKIRPIIAAEPAVPPPGQAAPTATQLASWVSAARADEALAGAQLSAMNVAENALLLHRLAVVRRWRSADAYGSAGLLLLGILGGVAGIGLFTKSIAARVDALGTEITTMDPDSLTEPPDSRADELGQLARQFRTTSRALAAREAELRHARAFLENILTVGPAVVVRTGGREGGATYVSPNCERVLGVTSDQVTSADFWRGLAPDDVVRYYESAARLFAADAPRFIEMDSSFELNGHRKYISVLLTRETVYDDLGLLVFFIDVTARRLAEQQAAERQRELGAITAASPDIITVFNADLRVLWTSEAFTSVLGYRISERIGKNVGGLVHDADRRRLVDAVRSVISGGAEDFTVRVRARHVSARWVTLEGHGRPSLGSAGDPVAAVVVFRDISERITLEAELVEARDAANAASVAKSEFLSRMSHELRTPLNVVLGFTQLLQMEVLGEEPQNWVGQILLAGRHLLDLINEVLDIARIESGALGLAPEAVALREIVTETVVAMAPIAAAHGVTISTDMGNQDLFVRADRQRLKQVILNLLSNAVKYNKPGGSVLVTAEADKDAVRFRITDTGIGIAPQHLQRLFTPFDRLGAEESSIEGTGVGLSLSLRLVQAMEGDISVDSTIGAGSTFMVTLPRLASLTQSVIIDGPRSVEVSKVDDLEGPRGTVLYIEDNLTNLHFMQQVVERRPGIRLVHALRGRIGLELVRSANPDVVLLDLHLPDMSGAEVLSQLRSDPATHDIPVFIVSADATIGQVDRMGDAGASGYLTKPLSVLQILALLDNALKSVSANDVSAHEGE